MGTVQIIQRGTRDVDYGGPRIFFCELTADKPASGLRKDDRAVTVDDGKVWIAASATTWAEQDWGWPAGGPGATEPPGVMKAYGGAAAPSGYLLCDGAAVSRATYVDLFTVIGTAYGAGDTSTTFNVPNLKGRIPPGLDAAIGDFDALGKTGGAKTVTLGVAEIPSHTHVQNAHNHTQDAHNHIQDAHNHAVTDPGHNHLTQRYPTATGGSSGFTIDTSMSGTLADNTLPVKVNTTGLTVNNATPTNQVATAVNQAATPTNQNAGGGGAHENMPPYVIVNWIIKT